MPPSDTTFSFSDHKHPIAFAYNIFATHFNWIKVFIITCYLPEKSEPSVDFRVLTAHYHVCDNTYRDFGREVLEKLQYSTGSVDALVED